MPTFNRRVSLAANGTFNAMQDSQFEYLPYPALVEIGLATDANGVLATLFSGSDVLAEEGPVVIKTINVPPVYPDDFQYNDVAAAGDRLKINLRDTSGAARVVMVSVRINPLV